MQMSLYRALREGKNIEESLTSEEAADGDYVKATSGNRCVYVCTYVCMCVQWLNRYFINSSHYGTRWQLYLQTFLCSPSPSSIFPFS